MSSKWVLKEVGNEGQLLGSLDSTEVVVPTKTLITDIKAQLMFIPNKFTWSVGWRAYVWQDEKTGRFQDLTEEEFKTLMDEGTVNYTRDGAGSDTTSGDSNGTERNSAE